jgi:ABC-2 type transport system permease protein
MKGRFLRIAIILAWLPAVALAGGLCVWGLLEQKSDLVRPLLSFLSFLGPEILADPRAYRVEAWTLCYDYFLLTELRFSMIVVLLVGPSLISQDLRFNSLPLYFSRPLRRIDYFLGKLGVIAVFLGFVLILPSLIAYALGLLFSLDVTIVRDTFPLLLACLGYGAIMTLTAGLLILALSSLSRNSRYIGLFWLGVWFVTSIVGTVLENVNRQHHRQEMYRKMAEADRTAQVNARPRSPAEQQKQMMARGESMQKLWGDVQREELEASKTDWRPMVSFTANLSRVGSHLLGTQAVWEKLSQNVPAGERARFLLDNAGPKYPWYWSAGVLAVLCGISVCILNFRVKSLDRLK